VCVGRGGEGGGGRAGGKGKRSTGARADHPESAEEKKKKAEETKRQTSLPFHPPTPTRRHKQGYTFYLSVFYLLVALLFLSLALCAWVGWCFTSDRWPALWPIKVARVVVSVFVSIFYMASLNIFLIALQCSPGGTVSGDVGAASALGWPAVLAPPPTGGGSSAGGGGANKLAAAGGAAPSPPSYGGRRRLLAGSSLGLPDDGVPFPPDKWVHLIYAKGE
jgi:hypothetical protein